MGIKFAYIESLKPRGVSMQPLVQYVVCIGKFLDTSVQEQTNLRLNGPSLPRPFLVAGSKAQKSERNDINSKPRFCGGNLPVRRLKREWHHAPSECDRLGGGQTAL